jgi:hypothetical protein
MQYRPVNINISIRIDSPGDNGPVVQANVAVGVTVPTPVLAPVLAPAQPPAAAAAPSSEPAPAAVETGAQEAVPASAPIAAAPVEVEDTCCLLPEPRGIALPGERTVSVVLTARTADAPRDTASVEGDTVAIAARFELRARRAASAAIAPPRPQARPARPATTRRGAIHDERSVVVRDLGFSVIGASDRVQLYVVLMLFAFAFASAAISWASARSRPTPGVDADEPPNRPG